MIGICPSCGNYEWNKEITEDKKQIICKQCGHQWNFKALPLFILTGCSGVGKTTTAQELLQSNTKFITMDADVLFNIMPHETEEDYKNWVEQIMSMSKNIMQCGKPLLWTIAGALEHFENTYSRRFFTQIYYLALVCDQEDLVKRMRDGRHITDNNWIDSSVNYNQWFIETGILSEDKERIETYNISGKSVAEVADYVKEWVEARI